MECSIIYISSYVYSHTHPCCSNVYLLTRFVMEELFAVLMTGSVEEVKKVFKETAVSPTVCNEV